MTGPVNDLTEYLIDQIIIERQESSVLIYHVFYLHSDMSKMSDICCIVVVVVFCAVTLK